MAVLAFGEVLFDVYVDENRAVIGGAPFNFARYYAAEGESSYLLSAVGKDGLGDEVLTLCSGYGVKTDYTARVDFPTGQVEVRLNENKVPSYTFVDDCAYHNITLSESELEKIKASDIDILAFGTLIQDSAVNRGTLDALLCLKQWREVFCDINIRAVGRKKEYLNKCLSSATILKFSDEEELIFSEMGLINGNDIFAELHSAYPNIKVMLRTMGSTGSEAFNAQTNEKVFVPANKVKVVTTVGAGDSFGAGFLASWVNGNTLTASLQAATNRAAKVISGN